MTTQNTKVTWNSKPALDAAEKGGAEGLKAGADVILKRANQHVPLEFGTLRDSGSTSVDEKTGEAVVSYDTVYALHLHEHPEFDFQNGREGKWLAKAAGEGGDEVLTAMAEGTKRAFR